ncbi:Glutamate-rich protein 1 [Plecturocebus cupreus]
MLPTSDVDGISHDVPLAYPEKQHSCGTGRAGPVFSTPLSAAEELLGPLASHTMPRSDVSVLHHMKTLLLLQDTESRKCALAVFPERCSMPPDHARVISAFFNYWITHILPEKSSE